MAIVEGDMPEREAKDWRDAGGVSMLGLFGAVIAVLMVVGSVAFYATESGLIGAGRSSATANTQRTPAATTGSGIAR